MTLEQYRAALKIITDFLVCRGYQSDRAEVGKMDGHGILWSLREAEKTKCTVCYEEIIRRAVTLVRSGQYIDGTPMQEGENHPWTDECTQLVFKAAGLVVESK